jgi:hypothetical protein
LRCEEVPPHFQPKLQAGASIARKNSQNQRLQDGWTSAEPPFAASWRDPDGSKHQMAHFVPNRCHTPQTVNYRLGVVRCGYRFQGFFA